MSNPLVTICIPTYQGGRFLGEAIESALAQSYAPLEVLVVDNASTDDSCAIVSARLQDKRLRLVQNPQNIGMVLNFRKGLVEARGELVLYVCSDDLLMDADFVQRAVTAILQSPDNVAAFGGVQIIDEHRQPTADRVPPFSPGQSIPDFTQQSLGRGENLIYLSACLFRKDHVPLEKTFIPNKFFDWHLWLTLSTLGTITYVGPGATAYRYHPQNESKQLTEPHLHAAELVGAVEDFLGKHPSPERAAAWREGKERLTLSWLLGIVPYRARGGPGRVALRSIRRLVSDCPSVKTVGGAIAAAVAQVLPRPLVRWVLDLRAERRKGKKAGELRRPPG